MKPNVKTVPFLDLGPQTRALRKELDAAWRRVVSSQHFILGGEVEAFEKEFAHFIGAKEAVGVSTGLDALTLSLKALGVGPGQEVIVPANSFIATALAVSAVGAEPVFADVDTQTLLLDLPNLKKVVTARTRAVIPVHLYGQPVDMGPLLDYCRSNGFFLVEDACQAHGASIGKQRCGTFGDAAAFSFYPGKNLGAFGDGGMVTTQDPALAAKIRALRNYGSVIKYQHPEKGANMRLDALQAAILRVKLKHLTKWNLRRVALARRYDRRLAGVEGLRVLPTRVGFTSVHHLYVVRVADREGLQDFLIKRGIQTGVHYPVPIHLLGAYSDRPEKEGSLPIAESACRTALSLPMYPEMDLRDADRIAAAVKDHLKGQRV